MTHINAPGVVQVTEYFSGSQGCTASNVFHVLSETAWDLARLDALLDVFETWETSTGSAQRVSEVACTGFRAVDLTSLDGPMRFRAENITGHQLTPAAPSNCTFALKLDTGHRGRGRNGRLFWFGLSEDSVDIAQIHTDAADNLVTAIGDLALAVAGETDMALAVLHRKRDGAVLDPQDASIVLGVAYTDNKLDSQRDRLPDHKRHKVKKVVAGVGGG